MNITISKQLLDKIINILLEIPAKHSHTVLREIEQTAKVNEFAQKLAEGSPTSKDPIADTLKEMAKKQVKKNAV